jgi:hypothetical protein
MGNKGVIRSGDVQWMTAGNGIIHQEMPKGSNGLMWGFQPWVNLSLALVIFHFVVFVLWVLYFLHSCSSSPFSSLGIGFLPRVVHILFLRDFSLWLGHSFISTQLPNFVFDEETICFSELDLGESSEPGEREEKGLCLRGYLCIIPLGVFSCFSRARCKDALAGSSVLRGSIINKLRYLPYIPFFLGHYTCWLLFGQPLRRARGIGNVYKYEELVI